MCGARARAATSRARRSSPGSGNRGDGPTGAREWRSCKSVRCGRTLMMDRLCEKKLGRFGRRSMDSTASNSRPASSFHDTDRRTTRRLGVLHLRPSSSLDSPPTEPPLEPARLWRRTKSASLEYRGSRKAATRRSSVRCAPATTRAAKKRPSRRAPRAARRGGRTASRARRDSPTPPPSQKLNLTSSLPIKSSDALHCHCMSVMLLARKMERGSAEREPPSCDIRPQRKSPVLRRGARRGRAADLNGAPRGPGA